MSRKFLLIALGTMAYAPAWGQGQTNVGTSVRRVNPLDTVRAMMQRRNPTIDEVRAFAAETRKTEAQFKVLVEKMGRERAGADERRREEMEVMYLQAIQELLGRQRTLVQMCGSVRPHPGESEGILGFQLDLANIATAFVRGAGNVKEERFVRPPEIGFVQPGSPAEKADVRVGDVWVSIAGRELVNSLVTDLSPTIKPGSRVDLKLRREGRDVNVEVVAIKRPEYPAEECEMQTVNFVPMPGTSQRIEIFKGGPPTAAVQDFFAMKFTRAAFAGAQFIDLTDGKRERLKVPAGEKGAVIESIEPGSVAEAAGLRELDVVLRANNEVIESAGDLMKVFRQGGHISLWIWDGATQRKVNLPAR